MARVRTSPWAVVAAVAFVLATPGATWWLVGDRSEDVAQADHLVAPLALSATAEQAIGLGAAVIAVASAAAIVTALWRRRLSRRWWPTLVLLMLAGVVFGTGWRILTAGVAGSNREAGFVLLFGLPLFVALVATALVVGLIRRPDTRGRRRGKRRGKRSKRTHIRKDSPVSSADRV